MPRKKKAQPPPTLPSSAPSISIGGNVGGSVTVGDHNIEIGSVAGGSTVIVGGESAKQTFDARQQATLSRLATPEEVASLASAFHTLDEKIDQDAGDDKKDEARQHADELKQAVAGDKPDVPAMEQAKGWFVNNLPAMLGTVTSILTHPLVGRLVEAAGEFTLGRFRQRLGLPEPK